MSQNRIFNIRARSAAFLARIFFKVSLLLYANIENARLAQHHHHHRWRFLPFMFSAVLHAAKERARIKRARYARLRMRFGMRWWEGAELILDGARLTDTQKAYQPHTILGRIK